MEKLARYLITTADERTWKFDQPVIFLGEWCRLHTRRHLWQGMDAIILPPYGLGKAQKDADHSAARIIEKTLFSRLCCTLNTYHGTHHGERFWRILLGHWFRFYVNAILNRVQTLEKCLQNSKLEGTTVFSNSCFQLASADTYNAIWAFNDDVWNNIIYSRILQLLDVTCDPVEYTAIENPIDLRCAVKPGQKEIKKWLGENLNKISGALGRKTDVFIARSSLPTIEEIKLQLSLRQMPRLYSSITPLITEQSDFALRAALNDEMTEIGDDTLSKIVAALTFELLPVCYLEGFEGLANVTRHVPWPKSPKVIFTSNAFQSDEVFKLYAATKIETGSGYIVGQHGNNYGTYRYMDPSIEETTSDKFLTWGWPGWLPQHVPAFVFTTANKRNRRYSPRGSLLLLETTWPFRFTTWDGMNDPILHFKEKEMFFENLLPFPKANLIVRLHSTHVHFKGYEEIRWREINDSIKLDMGTMQLNKAIAQSRLVVYSYDSTGILENLAQNIPTLAFWQNGFDHLRDTAVPFYQSLVDARIVHFTAESAASMINEVWDDVDSWWFSEPVQAARKIFCDRYARSSNHPISELKKLLMSDTPRAQK